MNSVGEKLIASIVQSDNGVDEYLKLGIPKDWFLGGDIDLYEFITKHITDYGVMPTAKTISKKLDIDLPETDEPPKYYADHLEDRYIQTTLKKNMLVAQKSLQAKNPKEALVVLENLVGDLVLTRNRNQIVNYTEEAGTMIHQDMVQKKLHGDKYGIPLGWNHLDSTMMGLFEGDLLSVVGRPATGKTYLELYMAYNGWMAEKTPMLMSMEMPPLALIQRLVALQTKVPVTKLKNAELATKMYETKVKGVLLAQVDSNMPPFWIVDGNLAATVQDIKLLCKQLKPDVLYVDGAYLLEPDSPFVRGPGEKVKNTCEGLKKEIVGGEGIPTVASYQFNRDQTKNKASMEKELEATGLEHIAGGDAIGQISSVVLGLFQEESVETLIKKHVKILKGRNGETGGFNINWLFDNYPFMDFSEIPEETLEDLEFM